MSSKNFCDRCGKEIAGMPFIIKAGVGEMYDLCADCKEKFEEYIRMETFK